MSLSEITAQQAATIASELEAVTVAGTVPVAALIREGKYDEALELLGRLDLYDDALHLYDELHSLAVHGRAW